MKVTFETMSVEHLKPMDIYNYYVDNSLAAIG